MDPRVVRWLQGELGPLLGAPQPVAGGCIHSAWRLQRQGCEPLFVKSNSAAALPLLQAEAAGLRALAQVAPADLAVPRPLACARVGDQAVLVLEWLDLVGDSGGDWGCLGRALAQLHRRSLEVAPGVGRFGWEHANFIGASPQPNSWCTSWAQFFVEQRLLPQLEQARRAGLGLRGGEALLQSAWQRLADHAAAPVLVHGDLWRGNAGLLKGGGATVFDPAVYRGDREVDLAMARLFGGFPAAFFDGYQRDWPLPADAASRRELYNLYHLLNHANLFGGGYRQQAQASMDALLA
jgi:fructosamine-3-kinase